MTCKFDFDYDKTLHGKLEVFLLFDPLVHCHSELNIIIPAISALGLLFTCFNISKLQWDLRSCSIDESTLFTGHLGHV